MPMRVPHNRGHVPSLRIPPPLTRVIGLSLSAALFLSACQSTTLGNERVNDAARLTAEQQRQMEAAARGEVVRVDAPYYGSAVVAERGSQNGEPLPARAEQATSIVFGAGDRDLENLIEVIEQAVQIPSLVQLNYQGASGQQWNVPIMGSYRRAHSGTLSHLLDLMAARFDMFWEFDGTTLEFARMREITYRTPLPTNTTAFTTSVSGINTGGNSATLTTNSATDPWADLEARLNAAIPMPGEIMLSRNSGTVTVLAPPSGHQAAERVITEFRQLYGQRIALEIGVFYVRTSEISEFEGGLTANLNEGVISGLTQALTGNGVATLTSGDIGLSMRALARNDAVVDFTSASSVSQSGVPTPIRVANARNYVSRQTQSVSNGTTTTSVETAELQTGLSIFSLPRLIDGGNIHLNLNILQASLASLDTFTSGTSTVQLPNTDSRAISSDVILSPGQTLILSGLEGSYTTRNRRSNLLLGGSNNTNLEDVRVIFIVRPSILPARDAS